MFSHEFLYQIASTYGLTSDQNTVFLKRFLDNKSHQEIANDLGISVSAGLRRMAEVYKKFNINGKSRGKDGELRKFLIHQLDQKFNSNESNIRIDERIEYLSDRLANFEQATLQESIISPIVSSLNKSYNYPSHNLPAKTNEFIGRKNELNKIIKCLSEDYASPIIEVDGIGGIGKTAFVLEAAYQFLIPKDDQTFSSRFDAIIFTSAKEDNLLPIGIIKRLERHQTLDNICQEIAFTLDEPIITKTENGKTQCELVKQKLTRKKILLIVDNLETLDSEEKFKVISFLKDLPGTVKSISVIHVDIRLNALSEEDCFQLIKQQTQEKSVSLNDEQIKDIYQASSGVPLAIIYAIGRLANSANIESVIEDLNSDKSDLAEFLFKRSVEEIKGTPAYDLLISLAIFKEDPLQDALVEVAGLKANSKVASTALELLQRISLITKHNGRYKMLSPTREYALAELHNNQDFEDQARRRWFNWHIEFAKKHGKDDWGEWHHEYDRIEEEWENFQEVLVWCALKDDYLKLKELWDYLNKCANLYGHWDDRLHWLNWLIQKSERNNDWATHVKVLTAYSWTLILQESADHLLEANNHQQKAWNMRERADPFVQSVLAENIAVLHIRQEKYEEARDWFNRYEKLVTESALDDLEKQRSEMRHLYYEAEIHYRQKEYDKAKEIYQKVVEKAKQINWLRFEINAQSWLATIAIKQRDFDKAERLLNRCLPVAERNHDKRRMACCEYSYARMEKARGNLERAREWAKRALESFERLGVIRDAKELLTFLEELNLLSDNPCQ
jgi:tetratricopeptide (TPR) repeat protein